MEGWEVAESMMVVVGGLREVTVVIYVAANLEAALFSICNGERECKSVAGGW
jgi:hypothetical protein